jgi:hypothetical protein
LTGLVARTDATDVLSAIVASVAHKVLTLAGNQESYLHIAVALGHSGALELDFVSLSSMDTTI